MRARVLLRLINALGLLHQCFGYTTTISITDSTEGQRVGHSTIALEDGHTLAAVGGFNVVPWHDGLHDVDSVSFLNATSQAWGSSSFTGELARNRFVLGGPFLVYSEAYYVVFAGQNSSTGEFCNDSALVLMPTNESMTGTLRLEAVSSIARGSIPSPRVSSAGTMVNNEMYMFGGEFSQADGTTQDAFPHSNELFRLILENTNESLAASWHRINTYVDSILRERPVPRSAHSFDAIDNSTLVLFGGKHYNFGQPGGFQGKVEYLDDTWLFRVQDRRWIRFDAGTSHPEPRAGHATATINGNVYLHGGFSLAANRLVVYDDLWVFKKTTGDNMEWEKLVAVGSTTPRAWHSLVVSTFHNGLLVVGGLTRDETTSNFSLVDGTVSIISGITL